ncbi:MAG: ABC transporter ATP-binding protein [Spirochaetales bacterium]|nr:ABC transporter ATP-binding protein [Spirochaetales bacterium]
MLTIQNLSRSVKGKKILSNINIRIKSGTIVSLLGPSGSGKTTLLRIIMGLEDVDEGSLSFGDTLLSKGKRIFIPAEQREFALVFQEFILFPHLDVYKNIVIGLNHLEQSRRRIIAEELLELFEITHLKYQCVDTLSGGEQQRVAIARTLAVRPRVLMLDEPFSNIDRKMKEYLYGRLQDILKQYNMTTILATHDHAEAFFFSDNVYVLKDGEIKDENPPSLLYTQPADPWVASFVGDVNYISGYDLKTLFHFHNQALCDDSFYLIRPEEFLISKSGHETNEWVIEKIEFYGFYRTIRVTLQNGKKINIKDLNRAHYTVGEKVFLRIAKTGESIVLQSAQKRKGTDHENNS